MCREPGDDPQESAKREAGCADLKAGLPSLGVQQGPQQTDTQSPARKERRGDERRSPPKRANQSVLGYQRLVRVGRRELQLPPRGSRTHPTPIAIPTM